MKAAVDNITLIKTFLKGEDSLLANRELRIEKALEETQLLTTQGILLAKGRLNHRLPNIVIRLNSDYWELIHQLALDASFIPLHIDEERLAGATFAQYDYHSVPAGYKVHCQPASVFWKTWWINHRKLQLMDMLLLCEKRWYPIQSMLCETGTIYVKTWRGEKILSLSDMIVWLDRNTQDHRQRLRNPRAQTQKRSTEQLSHTAKASSLPVDSANTHQSSQLIVPAALQQVVKVSGNKLLIQTVHGVVEIEGQNLSCSLARKVVKAS